MTLSVNYSELGARDGSSPLASYSKKGPASGPRKIRVKWDDRYLATKQCVGYSYAITESGVRKLRRELPEGVIWDRSLMCSSVTWDRGEHWLGRAVYDPVTEAMLPGYPNKTPTKDEDLNPTDALWKFNVFKWAVLSLTYSTVDYYIYPDSEVDASFGGSELYRYVKYRDDRSVSYLSVQGNNLYYIIPKNPGESTDAWNARRAIPHSTGIIEPKRCLYYTWEEVSQDAFPFATWDGMVGKTNSQPFPPTGTQYPAGTLLFMPPKYTRYVNAAGQFALDAEAVMEHQPAGWNKLLRVAAGQARGYVWVTTDTTILTDPTPGSLPANKFTYGEEDYAKLWVPNNP